MKDSQSPNQIDLALGRFARVLCYEPFTFSEEQRVQQSLRSSRGHFNQNKDSSAQQLECMCRKVNFQLDISYKTLLSASILSRCCAQHEIDSSTSERKLYRWRQYEPIVHSGCEYKLDYLVAILHIYIQFEDKCSAVGAFHRCRRSYDPKRAEDKRQLCSPLETPVSYEENLR